MRPLIRSKNDQRYNEGLYQQRAFTIGHEVEIAWAVEHEIVRLGGSHGPIHTYIRHRFPGHMPIATTAGVQAAPSAASTGYGSVAGTIEAWLVAQIIPLLKQEGLNGLERYFGQKSSIFNSINQNTAPGNNKPGWVSAVGILSSPLYIQAVIEEIAVKISSKGYIVLPGKVREAITRSGTNLPNPPPTVAPYEYIQVRTDLEYIYLKDLPGGIGAKTKAGFPNSANAQSLSWYLLPFATAAVQDVYIQSWDGKVIYAQNQTSVLSRTNGYPKDFAQQKLYELLNSLYETCHAVVNKDKYQEATDFLLEEMGAVCAYCEIRIPTHIEVEHMLPQSQFPMLKSHMGNFLLSCNRCNPNKLAHPTRAEMDAALKGTGFAPSIQTLKRHNVPMGVTSPLSANNPNVTYPPTKFPQKQFEYRLNDLDYLKLLSQGYYRVPEQSDAYAKWNFNLFEINGGTATGAPSQGNSLLRASTNSSTTSSNIIPITQQIDWEIHRIDEVNKAIIIYIPAIGGSSSGTRHFRVLVDESNPETKRTVDMAKLNQDKLGNRDRRVLERTEAWFLALAMIKKLEVALGPTPTGVGHVLGGVTISSVAQLIFDQWCENVVELIKAKGFFSVFLKIIDQFQHPLTNISPGGGGRGNADFASDFVQKIKANLPAPPVALGAKASPFPGTNWDAQMPQ